MAPWAGRSPEAPEAGPRTWFQEAGRKLRFLSPEAKRGAVPAGARPALPRAALARARCAEDGAAPRLDGRIGFVPVHGRRAKGQMGRLCARLARLRPDRMG